MRGESMTEKARVFHEQLGLLLELIDVADRHGNDSVEADAVRDRCETSWHKMDARSKEIVRQVSAEFNRLEDTAVNTG